LALPSLSRRALWAVYVVCHEQRLHNPPALVG
jgi:hypothetical protein